MTIQTRILFVTALVTAPLSLNAIVIQGENDSATDQWDRFNHGTYPGSPVENSSFFQGTPIPNALHGVGWNNGNSGQSFTLITPQHIVGANHFAPSVGTQIDFFNTAGNLVNGTVGTVQTVQNGGSNTDVFVAELNSRIDTSDVPVVRFPSDAAITTFTAGSSILPYGFNASMGTNTVSSKGTGSTAGFIGGSGSLSNTPTFEYTFNSTTAPNGTARVETGDSGSPTFFEEDGELTIVGTHSALAQTASVFTSIDADLTQLIDNINTTINNMGSTGFQLQQVPEPGYVGLVLGVTAGVAMVRRRRA